MEIVPICDGGFHLENEIEKYGCYICDKTIDEEMVLIRTEEKKFRFACVDHPGVIQEFVKQYKRVPLGWVDRKSVV
jgi:hypothetical protein